MGWVGIALGEPLQLLAAEQKGPYSLSASFWKGARELSKVRDEICWVPLPSTYNVFSHANACICEV